MLSWISRNGVGEQKEEKKPYRVIFVCVRIGPPLQHMGLKRRKNTSIITVLLSIIQPTYYVKHAEFRIQDVNPGTLIRIFSSRIQSQKGTGSKIRIRKNF